MDMSRFARTALAAAAAALLTAATCESSDVEFGRINLAVTDAPIDSAQRVVIEFTAVEIQPADGQRELFEFLQPRQIDLLALHGGGSELLLDDDLLPAGQYNWIRLHVTAGIDRSNSFIELDDGSILEIFIPSGDQRGLQLNHGFTVTQGGTVDFTIDFDLRRSIVIPPGLGQDVLMRPVLRIVDNTEVGAIAGTVDVSLIDTGCTPAVYVYAGAGTTPTDMQGETDGPLASGMVEMNTDGEFEYRVAFLEAGAYTVAFTCEADQDDPIAVDTIAFTGGTADATVTAGQTTTVDFPAGP